MLVTHEPPEQRGCAAQSGQACQRDLGDWEAAGLDLLTKGLGKGNAIPIGAGSGTDRSSCTRSIVKSCRCRCSALLWPPDPGRVSLGCRCGARCRAGTLRRRWDESTTWTRRCGRGGRLCSGGPALGRGPTRMGASVGTSTLCRVGRARAPSSGSRQPEAGRCHLARETSIRVSRPESSCLPVHLYRLPTGCSHTVRDRLSPTASPAVHRSWSPSPSCTSTCSSSS